MGRKGGNLLGGVVMAVVPFCKDALQLQIPCRGGGCFTRARMRQTLGLLVYLLCVLDKARVRSLPLVLWSSCSDLEVFLVATPKQHVTRALLC